MKSGSLTSFQFAAIHVLFRGPKRPGELYRALRKLKIVRNQGTFSRMVRRLEQERCLHVEYEKPGGSLRLGDCRLAVTDVGLTRWRATREFFGSYGSPPARFKPVTAVKERQARTRKGLMKKGAKKKERARSKVGRRKK